MQQMTHSSRRGASPHWPAEDPGALPPPDLPRRDGQAIVICLLVALVLFGGLVAAHGVSLLTSDFPPLEGAFTSGAEAAILTDNRSSAERP